MNRTLLIGATGRTGRQVVAQLLAAGAPIRAMARNPETANLPPGVEVVRGDLTLPETLDECLSGVDSVLLVWCAPAATVEPVIDRIARQARRIVFLSSPYQTDHPLFQAAQPNSVSTLHAAIERRIQESGRAWTFLRPGMFSANAVWWWAAQIRAGGVVRWPYGLAATAPIDERDIAAVAVRALSDDTCEGRDYVLTGPESLTHFEQVRTIGEALGRPLRLEEVTPDEWRAELPPIVPAFYANLLLTAWAAAVGHPAYITSKVGELTGRPPRTLREWASDHAAEFALAS